MRASTLIFLALSAGAASGLAGCSDKAEDTGHEGHEADADADADTDADTDADADADTDADIEIAGDYTDTWGGDHQISSTSWAQYGGTTSFAITQFDNGADYAIAQNDAANKYSPGLWSRFDWTTDEGGGLWYCQTAYDAATEDDALATPSASSANPSVDGCSGFPWTQLTPAAR